MSGIDEPTEALKKAYGLEEEDNAGSDAARLTASAALELIPVVGPVVKSVGEHYAAKASDKRVNSLFRETLDIVKDLGKEVGDVREKLAANEDIRAKAQPSFEELMARVKECGAVLKQHNPTFGNTGKHLKRSVVDDIIRWADEASGENNLAILLDQAGMGKTVVARDVLLELEARGDTILAIKADQQLSGIESPEHLQINLHLPDAVERVVGRLAEAGGVVVLVDQIDALSLSMARDQTALNVVLDLVARLRLIPNVRVIMSCRTFDLNNDPRLKQLGVKKHFSITELLEEEVKDVLRLIGLDHDRLSAATQQLLKVPLHLNLFVLAMESRGASDGLIEARGIESLQDLYTLLWRNVVRKAIDDGPTIALRERVISILTNYMNREQRTSAPQSITAKEDDSGLEAAADWLASEGILVPAGTEWSFIHQTFFDYCYAKEFVEAVRSLSETILQSDQGLFARPQIVHVLTYLRGVNPQNYLRELNILLTAEGLRAHLYDLVIRWFGAIQNPTENEWLITRRLFLDPTKRARLMAAMGGNPGWFKYMKGATLQSLLGQEESLDSLVIPYLISMLDKAQAEVINIVRPYLGRYGKWDRRLRWMLETVRDWKTPEAIELFEQVFQSLAPREIKYLYQLDDVANADARAGCRLVREAFDKVLEDYVVSRERDRGPLLPSLSAHLEVFNGSTMDNALKAVVVREPEYFLELMLPWLDRVLEVRPEPETSSTFYYPSDEFSYLGWYGDTFVVKHQLIEAYIQALTSLASFDSEKFRGFVARLSASPWATPQRLLAHAFRALPENYSYDAFRFLTGDARRLDLGDHDLYDTRQLLRAIYPHLTAEQRSELEAFILSYHYIRKYAGVDGLRLRGIEQLYLLQSIPRGLLTERGENALRELERKFPNERASESPTTMRMGMVGSPIPEEQAKKMSDRAWLRAMCKYKGNVRHKHDPFKGGAHQLGGVLVRLTKENPGRFYRLSFRIPDETDDAYVQAILNGLTESSAPAESLFAVIRRFAPHPERDIKGVIARVLEKRIKDGLPDDMFELLEGYVRGPVGVDEDGWKRREESGQSRHHDGLNSGPYSSYINSDRGPAFRTLMLALDEIGSDEAKGRKWEFIEYVVEDPSTALRAGAVEALLYILHEDRERAVTLFERLMDGHPALLQSHFTQEFIRCGLYRYYRRMKPFILALMNEIYEPLQQRGAELACIAAISPEALDSEDDRLDAGRLAEEALTGIAPWRRGAARVYATNITTEASAACVGGLLRLLNDEDEEVRRFVNNVFHRLPDEQFIKLRDFIAAYAASRSLSKEAHWFTEFLWEHGMLDPVFSLSVVETILQRGNESTSTNDPYRFSGGGEELVRLVLGIYTYPAADVVLRTRAMDVFDQLMNVYLGQALMVLGEWDRR